MVVRSFEAYETVREQGVVQERSSHLPPEGVPEASVSSNVCLIEGTPTFPLFLPAILGGISTAGGRYLLRSTVDKFYSQTSSRCNQYHDTRLLKIKCAKTTREMSRKNQVQL